MMVVVIIRRCRESESESKSEIDADVDASVDAWYSRRCITASVRAGGEVTYLGKYFAHVQLKLWLGDHT